MCSRIKFPLLSALTWSVFPLPLEVRRLPFHQLLSSRLSPPRCPLLPTIQYKEVRFFFHQVPVWFTVQWLVHKTWLLSASPVSAHLTMKHPASFHKLPLMSLILRRLTKPMGWEIKFHLLCGPRLSYGISLTSFSWKPTIVGNRKKFTGLISLNSRKLFLIFQRYVP